MLTNKQFLVQVCSSLLLVVITSTLYAQSSPKKDGTQTSAIDKKQAEIIKAELKQAEKAFIDRGYKESYDLLIKNEKTLRKCDGLINQETCGTLQLYLAYVYYNGKSVQMDGQKGLEWYKRAAESGNNEALQTMGSFYEVGKGVTKSLDSAYFYFEKSTTAGADLARVKNSILKQALKAYSAKSYELAFKLVKRFLPEIKTCKKSIDSIDCADLQFKVSYMYFTGKGTSKDPTEAKTFLQSAANQGSAKAMMGLGEVYYSAKDYKNAKSWYENAALKGDSIAMRYLGELYTEGKGVDKNTCEGYQWYKKASDAGDEFSKKKIEEKICYTTAGKVVPYIQPYAYYRIINPCLVNSLYEAKDYYASGKLKQEGQYSAIPNKTDTISNTYREGKFISYNSKGAKESESIFKKGKLDGLYTQYFEDGTVELESLYDNGLEKSTKHNNAFTISNTDNGKTLAFSLSGDGIKWQEYTLHPGYDNKYWAKGQKKCKYRLVKTENVVQEGFFEMNKSYTIKWNPNSSNWEVKEKI
jgi:hypothetical protein